MIATLSRNFCSFCMVDGLRICSAVTEQILCGFFVWAARWHCIFVIKKGRNINMTLRPQIKFFYYVKNMGTNIH